MKITQDDSFAVDSLRNTKDEIVPLWWYDLSEVLKTVHILFKVCLHFFDKKIECPHGLIFFRFWQFFDLKSSYLAVFGKNKKFWAIMGQIILE